MVNYDNVGLLVKPMPDDEVIIGRRLDHIAIIARAADAQLNSLFTAFNAVQRKKKLDEIILFSRFAIDEIKKRYENNITRGNTTISELHEEIAEAYVFLGLTEEQEDHLTSIIEEKTKVLLAQNNTSVEIMAIFDELQAKIGE